MIEKKGGRLKHLINNVFYPDKDPTFSEEDQLLIQIKESLNRFQQAWRNFDYADQDHIDIAIWEIHKAEVEYSLLNRKYRILKGQLFLDHRRQEYVNPRGEFLWLSPTHNTDLFIEKNSS